MKCPFCSTVDTQVKDSRVSDDGSSIKRRRVCKECGGRFSTTELVQMREIQVVKSGGSVVPFDRVKLARSVALACKKRGISEERMSRIVSSIERRLEGSADAEINTKEIASVVIDTLGAVDKVAQIRFASVYYNFSSVEDFMKFVEHARGEDAKRVASEVAPEAKAEKICAIHPAFKKGELF